MNKIVLDEIKKLNLKESHKIINGLMFLMTINPMVTARSLSDLATAHKNGQLDDEPMLKRDVEVTISFVRSVGQKAKKEATK